MGGLKIAFITPEAVPFAKTGGLADVSGALPRAVTKQGHSVKLFMPKYRQITRQYPGLKRLNIELDIPVGRNNFRGRVFVLPDTEGNPEYYFIDNDYFFDREELYRDPATDNDYRDNDERFIFFSRAVLRTLKLLDWRPDILHANDWQSALVPAFLKTEYSLDNFYQGVKSIFTIHNMGYQGKFPAAAFEKTNLDPALFAATGPFEFWGDVNFMKAAIVYSDRITTVSPTYAEEIQNSDEFGKGLQGVLKERSRDIVGIINGVDYTIWSPKRDSQIPHHYFIDNLSGKKKNKLELLHLCNFPLRIEQPLIGVISRLDIQKGFDLLEDIMDDIMSLDLQFVLLGTGDENYHDFFNSIEKKYPDRFKAFLTFDNRLAHLIEAGCDIFLMPSRYEPCGLNQMYSLKYGTVPVVRKTGGLADTVIDFDERNLTGTGFVFEKYDSMELLAAIRKAVQLYSRRRIWHKIVKQGMSRDFSWDNSARRYIELYYKLKD
nr:glycogen synthase GlgA [candidate division Zixibacteria bacterium]